MQPDQQPCNTVLSVIAAGDGRRLGIEPEHCQHRPSLLVERRFRCAVLHALGNGVAGGTLRLHPDIPERRADNGMRHDHPQRERWLPRKVRAHRSMPVQIDIVLDWRADLRPYRLVALTGFTLLAPTCLLARDIALVDRHVPARTDRDEHLATLALGAALVLPAMEGLAGRQHHHLPSGLAVALRLRLHGSGLTRLLWPSGSSGRRRRPTGSIQ